MSQAWLIEPETGDIVAATGPAMRVHQREDGAWQWTTDNATGFASDPFTAMLDAGVFAEVRNG